MERSIKMKSLEEMKRAAKDYANLAEHKSDPFAYSRAMSHMKSGIAGKDRYGVTDYGKDRRL